MEYDIPAIIAHNVKTYRIERGLSQEALAYKAGISVRSLSNIEKGINAPCPKTLSSLSIALGRTPASLLLLEEEKSPASIAYRKLVNDLRETLLSQLEEEPSDQE